MSEDTAHLLAIKGEVGKIAGIVEGMDKKFDDHADRMDNHSKLINGQDGRLRTVENRQHWYAGAASGVGGILAWVVQRWNG